MAWKTPPYIFEFGPESSVPVVHGQATPDQIGPVAVAPEIEEPREPWREVVIESAKWIRHLRLP